ncbi:MAG: hypothetical protein H7320_09775, partial [Ferruginibacter sp.]|nr:hypothetical protein [Ferruginibacter sp.]
MNRKFFNLNAFIRITRGGMLTGLVFTISAIGVTAQHVIPLYPGAIPNSITVPDKESGDVDEIRNVSQPTLTVFLPSKEKANRAAVIICPGGGYGSLVMDR